MRAQVSIREMRAFGRQRWRRSRPSTDSVGERRSTGASWRQSFLLSLLFGCAASAQTPPEAVSAEAHDPADSQLPTKFWGTWTLPEGGFVADGDLTFEAQSLSWGFCEKAPYRVLRQAGDSYLVQFLLVTPACQFGGIASFLIVEPAAAGIRVSICRDPREFIKPRGDRQCSRAVLVRAK